MQRTAANPPARRSQKPVRCRGAVGTQPTPIAPIPMGLPTRRRIGLRNMSLRQNWQNLELHPAGEVKTWPGDGALLPFNPCLSFPHAKAAKPGGVFLPGCKRGEKQQANKHHGNLRRCK